MHSRLFHDGFVSSRNDDVSDSAPDEVFPTVFRFKRATQHVNRAPKENYASRIRLRLKGKERLNVFFPDHALGFRGLGQIDQVIG